MSELLIRLDLSDVAENLFEGKQDGTEIELTGEGKFFVENPDMKGVEILIRPIRSQQPRSPWLPATLRRIR